MLLHGSAEFHSGGMLSRVTAPTDGGEIRCVMIPAFGNRGEMVDLEGGISRPTLLTFVAVPFEDLFPASIPVLWIFPRSHRGVYRFD